MNKSETVLDRSRIERLSTAIYLITGFFNDLEPLKWKLRTFTSDLVVLHSAIELQDRASKIQDLLGVAKNAGLISDENYSLLSTEFTRYIENIKSSVDLKPFLGSGHQPQEVREVDLTFIKDKSSIELLQKGHIDETVKVKALKSFGVVLVKKNSRQSIIINLLKRKKEVMIKDITPLVSGCSEKTVQRELSAMVTDGVLKRIGDKRWSRYALA